MKLKFKYLGQFGLQLILAVPALLMPYLFITGTALTINKHPFWMIYFLIVILAGVYLVWSKILTDINEIEVTNASISVTNIIFRRKRIFLFKNLGGYKDSIWSGYRLVFFDKKNKPLFTVYEHYYKNFSEFRKNLDLKYLGKEEPTLNKLLKIKRSY